MTAGSVGVFVGILIPLREMSRHTVTEEAREQVVGQRWELLLEVQDPRTQLEGWLDSATKRVLLREPSLFPPQVPCLQYDEAILESLQDEVARFGLYDPNFV